MRKGAKQDPEIIDDVCIREEQGGPKAQRFPFTQKDPGSGYMPQGGQGMFRCDKCGNDTFTSYAQTIPVDDRPWVYEYQCARCGHVMGLRYLPDEEDEE